MVGQPEGIMWVGSDLQFCVGGLDEEDWTSEAYNDFLAAAINLW